MTITQVWFNGYDIASDMTETDILDGTAIIVMVTLHISVGIYSHRLAQRLFIQPKIFDMMRLCAKTGVKVSINPILSQSHFSVSIHHIKSSIISSNPNKQYFC